MNISDDNYNYNDTLLNLKEIYNLSGEIDKLFTNNLLDYNEPLNKTSPTVFNWIFIPEYPNGFIEYKRTLLSYSGIKNDKLLRQIYWRIYEGIISHNIPKCYYIIGLEDSGIPSYLSMNELEQSVEIIKQSISNTELHMQYLHVNNTI